MRAIFEVVLPVNVRHALEKKSGLSEEARLYVMKWAMELDVLGERGPHRCVPGPQSRCT